ncbi:MAG: serine acetyltransferase [Fischerella sp. CENA71]|nr:serine acetyltransferase [Fischerella sp. CENA71]
MSVQVDLIANQKQTEDSNLSLWQQIKEDWIAHGRDWTLPGFRSVAVHRFGVWRKKIKPKILQLPFSILYIMLYRRIRNHYGIELLYTVKLGRRVVVHHQGTIIINAYASIGDDSQICQGVTLGSRYADRPYDAPRLGKGVEVGAGAKILGKVTIGDYAKIGANAVVLCDVPPGATAIGIPAKIIN